MPPTKDPITCHVLDTTTGKPAVDMVVTLFALHNSDYHFEGVTNADGRITQWRINAGDSEKTVQSVIDLAPTMVWTLHFETEKYYGVDNTFWPVVALTFTVKKGEHYHVPLLLGPFSYTTYRGS